MSADFIPYERTLDALDYLAGVAWLLIVLGALGFAAVRLRRALLPGWTGPPALVGDFVLGLALAIVIAQVLGTFSAFTVVGYPVACVLVAMLTLGLGGAGVLALPSRPHPQHGREDGAMQDAERGRKAMPMAPPPNPDGPNYGHWVVAVVVAAVFAGWAIPTLTGVAGGLLRADSLWYHMPLASRFVETGSTGELFFFDPIFFAQFYPANSEVLHAIPILAFDRDFVSPVLNLGFLGLGLLAGWAIGRPYGVAPQALLGAAVVLGAETMIDFQAGEALNDIVGVSFLLCAAAILVNGHAALRDFPSRERVSLQSRAVPWGALAVAGVAAGLAAGTKLSFLAPVALMTVAVVVIAPRGARLRSGVAWSVPMLIAGGYWYARNLVHVGNPIPFTSWGPLGLPSPERAFELRPGFSVAHYWNDTEVWFDWFFKYFAEELGPLWPLVLLGVVAGGAYAIWRGGEPILRALGAVALLTALAYVFTPLTAGGEEGEPIAFEWNVRYLAPAVAIGLAILPCLPAFRASERRRDITLGVFGLLALITTLTINQWPEGGHTKGALATGIGVLALFVAAWWLASRGWLGAAGTRRTVLAVGAIVTLGAVAGGFLLQRHYLERRYENLSPQLNIAEVVRRVQDLRDQRIAISGVRGVFNQYAFSGTDLSNHVQWLGIKGDDEAFLRIPDCETWREELNAGDYDFVVTMYDPYTPFTTSPGGVLTDTKEALWTREDPGAEEIERDGPVSLFRLNEPLDPAACGDLPDLSPAELNGDSVNLEQLSNQPPPGAGS
jgi:hypothetical protein